MNARLQDIYTKAPGLLGHEARYSQTVQKSGRTTAQVIVEMELNLYSHIIGPEIRLDHGSECRCEKCWLAFQARWAAENARGEGEPELVGKNGQPTQFVG